MLKRRVSAALVVALLWGGAALAADAPAPAPPDASAIVARAAAAAEGGDLDRAVDLYASVYRLFPDDPAVPDALWRAAGLARRMAGEQGRGADWERVRSLYRDFAVTAPKDPRLAEAYMEIARINLRLRLYPEARSYLRMVMKRFPASPLADTARYLLARVEIKLGRVDQAEEAVRVLMASRDEVMRNRAALLRADILAARGRLSRAVALARRAGKKFPPGSPEYVDSFRISGRARLLMSDARAREKGREDLFYYLNVAPDNGEAAAVRLLLADSLFKEKNYRAAKRFFDLVARSADPASLAGVRARFRLAMIRDLGLVSPPPPGDSPTWKSGEDEVYHQAVRRLSGREAAQSARYLLMRRMLVRGDEDGAYSQARDYLDAGGGEWETEVLATAAGILDRMFAEWLKEGRHARVYETYRKEYPVIKRYRNGRLLFKVGRALEAMGLYSQASVVYYRALGLELTPAERDDLYLHRVRTYLAGGDMPAAGRLLSYLRRMYRKGDMAAEVRVLYGRFLMLKGRKDEAVRMTAEAFSTKETGNGALALLIREAAPLILSSGSLDMLEKQLDRCRKSACMPPEELQEYYVTLGDALRGKGLSGRARKIYRVALTAGPADTKPGRKAAFLLGASGDEALLEKLSGDDLWAELARVEAADRKIRKLAGQKENARR